MMGALTNLLDQFRDNAVIVLGVIALVVTIAHLIRQELK